jgi:RNA polymerase sigma-70 factor, ECF subfamily
MPGSHEVAQLFSKYGAQVYRRAYRLLGNAADADEATQEIFVRVVRTAEKFRGDAQPSTWLYQIATNYCLKLIRDRKRQAELSKEHLSDPEENEARRATSEEFVQFRKLLKGADPQQAEAAIYVYVDGMSHDEAAELLGVSRRTVGNLLERFSAWAKAQESVS